jgi:predicted tellurium resistance membrane protein TerC
MSGNLALAWEVFEIVWINILLSGDNAILIALACRRLPQERRRWGVLLGSLGGVACAAAEDGGRAAAALCRDQIAAWRP